MLSVPLRPSGTDPVQFLLLVGINSSYCDFRSVVLSNPSTFIGRAPDGPLLGVALVDKDDTSRISESSRPPFIRTGVGTVALVGDGMRGVLGH